MRQLVTFLNLLLISMITPLRAEVITDGALGTRVELSAPNYQIGAELGQQYGNNLFHSFQEFNLTNQEIATFTGPATVTNIISRVTGDNPSTIDGTIRVTIPNANMYFLNPHGIIFGAQAKLDIPGSFHATTADTLHFQDGGEFNARQPGQSILTVAPIASFGFLTNQPATITVQDSQLTVAKGQTLSLIGGDLILNGHLRFDEQGQQQFDIFKNSFSAYKTPQYTNQLYAEAGQINLVSIASPGKVTLSEADIALTTDWLGGKIQANRTSINANGESGGSIFIRSGNLELVNSQIQSKTLGEKIGKGIDIQTGNLLMTGGENFSGILTYSHGLGQAGSIRLQAEQATLNGAATIGSDAWYLGDLGSITINVTGTLALHGEYIPEINNFTVISQSRREVIPYDQSNHASHFTIEAGELILTHGSAIGSATVNNQDVNDIDIKVHNSLTISGFYGSNSSIASLSLAGSPYLASLGIAPAIGGKSGDIKIEANQIIITDDAVIASNTFTGEAGEIDIHTNNLRLQNGGSIFSLTGDTADGGTIHVQANNVELAHSKRTDMINPTTSISASSWGNMANAGDAGNIRLEANNLYLTTDNSSISSSATNAAGGNLTLQIAHLFHLINGEITTSVSGGTGKGGDITIESPEFLVLEQGKIIAQADAGQGGNIHLQTQNFIRAPENLISASSKLGIDGKIVINSPELNLDQFLVILPGEYLPPMRVKDPCHINDVSELNSFQVTMQRDGRSMTPGWFQD